MLEFTLYYSILRLFAYLTLALYCTLKKWIAHFRKHQERNWCTLAGFRDSIYSMYVYTLTSVLVYFTHNVLPSDHSKEKAISRGTFCWKYWLLILVINIMYNYIIFFNEINLFSFKNGRTFLIFYLFISLYFCKVYTCLQH